MNTESSAGVNKKSLSMVQKRIHSQTETLATLCMGEAAGVESQERAV